MNRVFKRCFFRVFCVALFCVGLNAAFANEELSFPDIECVEQKENLSRDWIEELTDAVYFNDAYYLQRIHNDGYYHLMAFSGTGEIVQLHDGSKWEVQPSGRQKVLYWVQSDDIFIKPVASCFSPYQYVLHNRTTNQAVEVNCYEPPFPMAVNTFRITHIKIELHDAFVILSDNTAWHISLDTNVFRWQVGQRLLVGVNNYWRTTPFPHILINVDIPGNPYSKANFYGYRAN